MKTWLKICSALLLVGLVVFAAWWQNREPEECALCGNPAYHAPLLVNLSTGESGPLTVYDLHPADPHALSPWQSEGTFRFLRSAGLTGYQDTATYHSRIEVPITSHRMNSTYFCKSCQELLADVKKDGYVLADLYNMDAIQLYPISSGAEYEIRCYSVSIEENGEQFSVTVYGNLK